MLTFSEVFTYDLPRPARESSDRPRVFPSLPTRAALCYLARWRNGATRYLAEALKRALPEIPDRDPLRDKGLIVPLLRSQAPLATWGCELASRTTVTPADEFGGPRKRILRGYIRFCELGSFEIW
jgi:hypothetical protein